MIKPTLRPLMLLVSLLGLGCSPEDSSSSRLSPGDVTQQEQSLTFQTSAGVVSMEAENFTSNTAQGSHTWQQQSESGASSGLVMVATPNTGAANNTGYPTTSPRLDFQVNFAQAGTYAVWVRGRDVGPSTGNSDSIHVGLDGQAVSGADRISSFSTSLGWSRSTMDNVNATINVTTAGVHTVNAWMREDGFVFDKLVLSIDSGFTPTGSGPAETAVPSVACGDGVCSPGESCQSCATDCGPCPTCGDGIRNGDETGTDCGGSCDPCPDLGITSLWLEAEAGSLSGSPGFSIQTSGTAASGQYLASPTGSSYDSPGSARVTFTFEVGAGTYKLWARTIAPNADDDSFWVSVDGGAFVKWNSIPASSSWAWDDLHDSDGGSAVVSFTLASGSHTLVMANREDGVLLDKIYLTAGGDVPTGLGGTNGTCSDDLQNQGEEGVDCGGPCPACPICTDGETQMGTTPCGQNGRGTLDQLCALGQWEDTSNCVDPDVCPDGQMEPGTSPCGQNGRGLLERECVAGQWEDSTVCIDPDDCTDDSTQPGTTPCSGGGTLEQICVVGQWVDSSVCVLPPQCMNGETQPGTSPCGLNSRGVLQQVCAGGTWADSGVCLDPDQCVDGGVQPGTTACGLNGRGALDRLCVLGTWTDSATCVDADVCTDGTSQPGTTACGLNGRGALAEVCVAGQWQDSSSCSDPDECVDGASQPGSTPCGSAGALSEVCVSGQWQDSTTCVEPELCTDGVQNGDEIGTDCGGSCPPCEVTAVWLEAEEGTLSGNPGFGVGSGSATASGSYLTPPSGASYDTAGSARVSFTFDVAAGSYVLWARMITPNADDDSFWVSMDGGAFAKWNSIPASSSWAWDDVHDSDNGSSVVVYDLTAGTHTLVVANREDGALLDKLYLTAGGDVPSGTGGSSGTCSDGVQNQGEQDVDCGGPCAPCPTCGDSSCDAGETCVSCGVDCGPCGACGDEVCDPDETCSSCEEDCGACAVFSSQDIGAVGAAGGLVTSGDAFTVTGSGADINSAFGNPVDEFHFVYQPVAGDVTVLARVTSVGNTNEWAKGGVMIRESLGADSKYALVSSRPDGQVQAQFREQVGQTGTDSGDPVGGGGSKWLMVERVGNQFRTYYSTDGDSFTQVGSTTTITMGSDVYVGLAVTSHNDGVICTAEFDQVSVVLPAVCGDAVCDASEDCLSCATDCGSCGACGDATCDLDETCLSCETDCGACPPTGLDTRPTNPTCVAPAALSSTVNVSDVWSNITFSTPMQVVQPPGDDSRLIVVLRNGTARSAPLSATSSSQVTTFLTLSNVVTTSNGGFLSMAFHPNWQTNRYAYVVYTTNNRMKRLSRFQSTDGGQTLNPGTEQVILQSQHDHEFNHNGGQIAFGKDGYLYMSTGDDAYLDYTRARHAAQTDNWFGKMLRIDVDGGTPYAIPADNPFAGGGGAPEVYAYGLRNPWRFSFDRLSGDLWLGDVGEDTWEEVNVIQKGEFYGWPYHEGDSCFTGVPADCATSFASPEYRYTSGAASISGGFVYRGPTLTSLYGKYVFGDYVSGQVSVYDPQTGSAQAIPGSASGGAIVGFGEGNDGELYVVRISTGRIQKLVPGSGGGVTDFPALLSDTGCFQPGNPTQVVSGAIPYDVAQPFWSDGVVKERYLAIPDGSQISIDSTGDWVLPPGGVTIKNFRYQGKLFETRFFVRHSNGTYSGYTYQWNESETQATLVPPAGAYRDLSGLDWNYPARGECFACHTGAAGYSLGPETRQMNIDAYYAATDRTANQLLTLDFIGMLSGNKASMTPFPAVDDTNVPVDVRAEAYLHINCSNCHRPGGPGGGPMDVRFDTPFGAKGLCNEPATLGNLGLPGAVLLQPGDHMSSVAWLRLSDRENSYSMPPLASTIVDAAGAALIQEWIDGLSGCP